MNDFDLIAPISVMISSTTTNNPIIRLSVLDDDTTLEYDERIILIFSPDVPGFIGMVEEFDEYIRDTAIVNVIDNDGKCILHK